MTIIHVIDQGPTVFRGFVLSYHPIFWDCQKEYDAQKVARVKRQRKRKGKGQEKCLERAITKKV